MFDIDAYLQTVDLMPFFIVGTLLGILLSVLDMTVTVYRTKTFTFQLYRAGFLFLVIMMAWAFSFSTDKGWEPWPPLVGLLFAIDYLLFIILMRHWEISRIDRKNTA